ncbi:Mus7/MMS22 family-domain-containing protein [Cubamyces menziesii]|nr:Mus7/MMS22 family-domain-containing protein [Cubamyces menziesii]
MPAVLIKRLEQKAARPPPPRHSVDRERSRGREDGSSDEEERPLRPGETRRRIRTQSNRSIEIRGDSESSDINIDVDANDPQSPTAGLAPLWPEEEIMPIAHRPRPRTGTSHRTVTADISLSEDSADSVLSDSAESISDDEVGNGRAPRRPRHDGEARGAKRYGSGRQTLLPFKRLPTPEQPQQRDAMPADPSSPTNEVRFEQEVPHKTKPKLKKHKPQTKLTGLYVFGSGGAHIVSGRANSGHVTVDQEAEAASYARDAPAPPGRTSRSHSKRSRVSSAVDHPVTLDEFWALAGAEESDDSFVVPDAPVPQAASSQQRNILEHLNRVTVDLDVQPLPAGIAFPNTTYLGRGWLYELIHLLSGDQETPSPPSCSMFDCYLHYDMSVGAFSTCLESVYDQLRNLIFGALVPANYETCNKWQTFLHAISQHLSWLLAKSAGDVHTTLAADTESLVQRLASLMEEPVEVLPDDEKPNPLVVQVLWFLTEASCRLLCDRWRRMEEMDPTIVSTCIKALMSKLWDFTFGDSALPLDLSREGLLKPSEGQQIAELWICLLDLTSNRAFEGLFSPSRQSFWLLYLEVLQTRGLQAPQTDLRAREAMWRSIFTLCALSQFSLHGNSTMAPRLSASWQTIAAVLERAPLSADPAVDVSLSKRGLRKRDEYVRVLVSRCLWLNLKWHWRLDVDDASLVFNRLLDVFKSRRFANLADEPSDFPSFLRHSNLALLHESKRSDTAFTLFLKLVVRAADEMRKQNPQLAQATTIPPRLKKILSLAVPVGSVPFTKTTPPSAHELSMLYNRFSAVAVAVYLEPTVANLKYRLANARRYVNFKDTDNETRRACIRGAMHLGTLLRHLDLPLADILDWLGEMTNTLIDEYQAKEPGKGAADFAPLDNARRYIVVCIQLILGCVRHILETSSMNPEESRHKYPDPALLQGPWVTRVFSTATTLSSVLSTGDQIRRLVQAFLDARSLVIPKPRRPQPRVVAEDSQESQYDYDQFDLDLDDPELLAALGENLGDPEAIQNKEKDKIVCEIIDKHISPAIYRLVCKHFNDPVYKQTGELSFEDADRWIDCWVGCASVVVQNGKKDWDFYLSFGPQSWEKIIEPDWRRRVGLRFMYMLLQLDPPAYLASTDLFIEVLFQSMATPTITLEHEYMALLLSIDRLHHPLFHDLPIGAPGDDGDYHLSKHEFSDKRIAFLRVMFKNLTDSLVSESNGDHSLIARNQIHITTVSRFLETVQDIYDRLPPASVTHAAHRAFCKAVFTLLSEYPSLSNHARLAKHMNWLRGISQ